MKSFTKLGVAAVVAAAAFGLAACSDSDSGMPRR
jgi:hypothetical protein